VARILVLKSSIRTKPVLHDLFPIMVFSNKHGTIFIFIKRTFRDSVPFIFSISCNIMNIGNIDHTYTTF